MQIKSQLDNYKEKSLSLLQKMGDVRFAGQVLFVVIVLLISWSGVKTIQTNYGLQKQISGLKQQNDVQKLQNDNLTLQNQYLNTNQYLELSARQNFGLAAPGEKEVVVPASVAQAYTVDLPGLEHPTAPKSPQPPYQHDVQSWVNFFLHRQDSQD
ncbi:MAG TPA: septum formation initiator family protein [Candidatus Saccharimonadia bacterium]|nr:septum formation initiator family protein [Candidatus Saccharimonadia bacterium]